VADYESSKAGIAQVEADLGPIEVVVANAGITRDAMFHRMTPEQWNEVIATNLTGVFNTVHPVWPGMRERKFGRIIVISSINGQKGQAGQVNYAATKAGDLGIVKSLAQEGARAGITANAICPGYIGTEMVRAIPEDVLNSKIIPQIPAGRLGEPEEIARCVCSWRPTTRASSTDRRFRPTARSSSSDGNLKTSERPGPLTPAFSVRPRRRFSGGTRRQRSARSSWRIRHALRRSVGAFPVFEQSFPSIASSLWGCSLGDGYRSHRLTQPCAIRKPRNSPSARLSPVDQSCSPRPRQGFFRVRHGRVRWRRVHGDRWCCRRTSCAGERTNETFQHFS
jgi:NAD(P)-dependent dehydrogenase (short-subunit alcohol dehydrogenase family)